MTLETRPANCRHRLHDEGKPHPKSGCNVEGCGGVFGAICERITFERQERGTTVQRGNSGKPRAIIDWRVMIDGEHRATFRSQAAMGLSGYTLRDLSNKHILKGGNLTGEIGCRAQSQFLTVINAYIGRIPTAAQIAEREAERNARQAEIAKADLAARELEQICSNGPRLLAALQQAKRLIDEALPKFNWAGSALSADAIRLLNETPTIVNSAIAAATVKVQP